MTSFVSPRLHTVALALRALRWEEMDEFATTMAKALDPLALDPLPFETARTARRLTEWADDVLGEEA